MVTNPVRATPGSAPPRLAARAAAPPTDQATEVLRYPAATTVTFLLLIAMLVLAGVFVGNMLYLGTPGADPTRAAPLAWLAWPPVLAATATVALTLAAPLTLERRRGLVPVPSDVGAAARVRVRELAGAASVRPVPELRWDPTAVGASALAYGRPGRYRISVTPALLGAARRRPAAFDAVARHELAHVRHHDVVLAHAAVSAWYAVVPLLVVPLVPFVLKAEWSLVAEYLVRTGVLALAVYLVRADLLRSREHAADVRAALWSPVPDDVASALATEVDVRRAADGARARGGFARRAAGWFALHPSPARRLTVVRRPDLLGRARPLELLAAGLLAGASVQLFGDLVLSVGSLDVVQSDRAARALLFGGLGAYAAISVARAAGTRNLLRWTVLLLAVSSVAGVGAGFVGSIGRTGLTAFAGQDAVTGTLTAVLAGGAVVVLLADLTRGRPPRATLPVAAVVLFGAVSGALAANATLALSQLAGGGVLGQLWADLPFVVAEGHAATALGVLLVLAAVIALAAADRSGRAVLGPLLSGAVAGLLATAWMVGTHVRAGALTDDGAKTRFFFACVWLAVAAAGAVALAWTARARGRLPAGIVAGAAAVVVAGAGFVVSSDLAGSRLGPADALRTIEYVGGIVTVLGLPLAALVSALATAARRSTGAARARRGRAVGLAVTAAVAVAATALVLGVVPTVVSRTSAGVTAATDPALGAYLATDLPRIAGLRDSAVLASQQPQTTWLARRDLLLSAVLPAYDEAIRDAEQVTGPASVQSLNAATLTMLRAERTAFAAEAEAAASADQAQLAAVSDALARAQEAAIRWQQEYSAASQN